MGNGQSAADEDQSKSSDLIKPREPSKLLEKEKKKHRKKQSSIWQNTWSITEIQSLLKKYETLEVVRELKCKYFRSILVDINKTHVKIGCDILDIAIKVFEIGQFLETPSLIRGCEDIIVNDILASYLNLSTTILNKILEWSSIDSKYVYQQTIQFLREKFIPLGKDFSEIDKTTESGKVQIKNHIFCKF
nr:unnamed protein product [Hydra vulgaris]